MGEGILQSIVSSIQTATSAYFSPNKQSLRTHRPEEKMVEIQKEVFKDIVYYDPSSALDQQHHTLLRSAGAVEHASEQIDWTKITHVFTHDIDFPGKQDAAKHKHLTVVTVFLFCHPLSFLAAVD